MELADIKEECDDVVIKIEDLSVWIPEEKSWWRSKVTKPRVCILNKISGSIKRGEFIAVLGPSGSGKTTFLVSLAGKCRLPSSGTVVINGRDTAQEKSNIEIVPQFEVFMPGLTATEHLVFMMELKIGNSATVENQNLLRTLIDEFKLKNISGTNVSNLSGGEKRLLSLATSLLSSPQILVCDEPTTGLDSHSASLVVDILKKLTVSGRIVICSVHQPSPDLFKEFNSIVLMGEGKLLFHGSHDECKNLFDSINIKCPKNYNPAEFYIRAVSNLNSTDNMRNMTEIYDRRLTTLSDTTPMITKEIQISMFHRSWFKQVQLLLWRSLITARRDTTEQIIQLFINVIISSVVIGTCYIGISGTTQKGIQDISGLLWLMTSEVCFNMSYNALFAFESEMPLFKREVGTYSCSAYFMSRFLGNIPRCIIWSMVQVVLMTLIVELPNHALTTTLFFFILSATAVSASAYGLGMAALFTSSGAMGDVMPCADLPLFLVSGVFLRISSLPLWLLPLRYISHFYYAMDAISNVYWRQIGYIECTSYTPLCIKDGASVLSEKGYASDFILQDSLGLLFVMIFWCILAYCGLKREERKGYAY